MRKIFSARRHEDSTSARQEDPPQPTIVPTNQPYPPQSAQSPRYQPYTPPPPRQSAEHANNYSPPQSAQSRSYQPYTTQPPRQSAEHANQPFHLSLYHSPRQRPPAQIAQYPQLQPQPPQPLVPSPQPLVPSPQPLVPSPQPLVPSPQPLVPSSPSPYEQPPSPSPTSPTQPSELPPIPTLIASINDSKPLIQSLLQSYFEKIDSLQQLTQQLQQTNAELTKELEKYKGSSYDHLSLEDINKLIKSLKEEKIKRETDEKEQLLCSICMDNKKNMICMPCGHVCVCEECSRSLTCCPVDNLKAEFKKVYL